MKFALVHDAAIVQFVGSAAECFPVADPLTWQDVPDDTTTRDTYVNGAVLKAPVPGVDLKAYIADARYNFEVGGIVSQSFGPLLTDRATQSMLARTIQSIDLGIIAAPINFKAPSGFVQLDRAALVAISTEVAAHVQTAFGKEAQLLAGVDSGSITTTTQIDAAFS